MPRFRKKPLTISAVQYTDTLSLHFQREMLALLDGCIGWYVAGDGSIVIPTANGPVTARPGDWVCRQFVNGVVDVWPCADAIFAATYEAAD